MDGVQFGWASAAIVSCRTMAETIRAQQQELQTELEACIDCGAVHYLKNWFCAIECLKQLTAALCWTITSFFCEFPHINSDF